jgi:hypothetical protein
LNTIDLDIQTPGGVYLCQVNDDISCGACCGLYNIGDSSLENLNKILKNRSMLFSKTKRDIDSILIFKELIGEIESQERPYHDFHHCPYIGYIKENCIGCLLHPLGDGNNGVDLRGLSYYGGFACSTYFCQTCHKLNPEYKDVIRQCAKGWHSYGLIITEHVMLNNFFQAIESQSKSQIDAEKFKIPKLKEHIQTFIDLKTTWKFRPKNFRTFGNYFFEENLYPLESINYSNTDAKDSEFNDIFMALNSIFKNNHELKEAEVIIRDIIDKICYYL